MAERTCASCGGAVGVLADRCPSCGADPELRLLELGVGPGSKRRPRPASHGRQPRRPGIGWRQWAPIVAVAVAAWGFLALSAGDSGDDEDEATEQADDEDTTTTRQPRPTRRGPRPPTTTTTLALESGPVLPEPTGVSLVLVGDPHRVVDLDAGTVRELDRNVLVHASGGGRLLVSRQGEVAWWPAPFDGTGAVPVDVGPVDQAWADRDGTHLWYTTVARTGSPRLRLADGAGTTLFEHELGVYAWVVGAVDGGVVLSGSGGSYLATAEGIRRLADGLPIAASGERVVVQRCDDGLVCSFEVVDLEGNPVDLGDFELSEPTMSMWGFAVAMSVDGRVAQLVDDDDSPAVVIDGELVEGVPGRSGLAGLVWSPDGRWLFVADGSGDVQVVDPATRSVVGIVEPPRGDGGTQPAWQLLALALP